MSYDEFYLLGISLFQIFITENVLNMRIPDTDYINSKVTLSAWLLPTQALTTERILMKFRRHE